MKRQKRMMGQHVLFGSVNGEQRTGPLQVELDVSTGRQLFGGELERSMGVLVGKSGRDESDCEREKGDGHCSLCNYSRGNGNLDLNVSVGK